MDSLLLADDSTVGRIGSILRHILGFSSYPRLLGLPLVTLLAIIEVSFSVKIGTRAHEKTAYPRSHQEGRCASIQ